MATSEVIPSAPPQHEELFRLLDEYAWDADAEFQGGLRAILGPNPDPERAEQLTLRARCFYYSRKYNVPIDFTAYRTWHTQYSSQSLTNGATNPISFFATESSIDPTLPEVPPAESNSNTTSGLSNPPPPLPDGATFATASASAPPAAPYPPTFSQIVELITTGQPIPNIKEVPDTVLEGQESQATTAKRKKPWEKD